MKYSIFNEALLLAIAGLLFIAMLSTPSFGAELKANCWSASFNNMPCRIRTVDDKVWLLTFNEWTDIYFVSDTAIIKDELYLLLLKKGQ